MYVLLFCVLAFGAVIFILLHSPFRKQIFLERYVSLKGIPVLLSHPHLYLHHKCSYSSYSSPSWPSSLFPHSIVIYIILTLKIGMVNIFIIGIFIFVVILLFYFLSSTSSHSASCNHHYPNSYCTHNYLTNGMLFISFSQHWLPILLPPLLHYHNHYAILIIMFIIHVLYVIPFSAGSLFAGWPPSPSLTASTAASQMCGPLGCYCGSWWLWVRYMLRYKW